MSSEGETGSPIRTLLGGYYIVGTSFNVKPTDVPDGALFVESNTFKFYHYNAFTQVWRESTHTEGSFSVDSAQTFSNKTIVLSDNIVKDTSAVTGDLARFDGTKYVRFGKGNANEVLRINATGTDIEWGSAATSGTWDANATETFTNKTVDVNTNSIKHTTTNLLGDILKGNGTKFDRFPKGSANQVLKVNAGGTDLEWGDPSTSGTWNPNATETITNKTIVLDNNTLNATSGAIGDMIRHDGTKFSRFAKGTARQVLRMNSGGTDILWSLGPVGNIVGTTDAQTLEDKTIVAIDNTITDTSATTGDLFRHNGTRFVRFPRGSANQQLRTNASGTNIEWFTSAGATPVEELRAQFGFNGKDNISSSFTDSIFIHITEAGSALEGTKAITSIDFTGKTQFKVSIGVVVSPSDNVDVRIVDDSNTNNILESFNNISSPGSSQVTSLQSLPGWATGVKTLRLRIGGGSGGDDCGIPHCSIYLK